MAKAPADEGVRTIKKYPNRRLYDTTASSYVTLADIKQLVMQHAPFVVRDAKSGEDLTRSILLQIILEEEAAGTPLLSEATLANIIRFYGHAMQNHVADHLSRQAELLAELQQKWRSPTAQAWQEMQNQFQKNSDQMLQAMGWKRP